MERERRHHEQRQRADRDRAVVPLEEAVGVVLVEDAGDGHRGEQRDGEHLELLHERKNNPRHEAEVNAGAHPCLQL